MVFKTQLEASDLNKIVLWGWFFFQNRNFQIFPKTTIVCVKQMFHPSKFLSLKKQKRIKHSKSTIIIIITLDVPFDSIISSIPNKLIKQVIQLLEEGFRDINAKNWEKTKKRASNRDLITVTLPMRQRILCFQQLRVCSIWLSFGIKLSS